jgi:arylsulfatase A-like enzyme
LFNELTRVPLIVKLPHGKQGGKRIDVAVEIIDVAPTILSLLGVDVPELMQGQDLSSLIEDRSGEGQEVPTIFSWSSGSRTVTRGEWKLVWNSGSGLESLYNLVQDPGELHDLAGEKLGITRRLHRLLEDRIRRNREIMDRLSPPETEPDHGFSDEERKRLELLGYVE